MKVLKGAFIHDHNFVYDEANGIYYDGSGGAFDENLWRRYLSIFDNLLVIGRQVEKLPNKLVQSSTESVSFHLIQNANSFKNVWLNKIDIKNQIKSALTDVDFAIIRVPSILGNLSFEICRQLGKPYLLEVVGDPFEAYWYHGSIIGKIIAPIEGYRLRGMTKRAPNVIYVTQSNLQKKYPSFKNSIGISNVRLEEVVPLTTVKSFYEKMKPIFKVGLIGSFHVSYKGHHEALKALKELKRKGYMVELSLVGTGNPEWVLKLAKSYDVADQVKMIGAVKAGNEGVIPYLDGLDLYIHPSKTEGLPRVIIEAMSRGKICLASNVGGTDELLPSKYLHNAGDWKKLAIQIESIINLNSAQKIDIASTNLATAEKYLEDNLQNKRLQFFNKVISKS